jgi:hypothetical protein
LSTEVNRSVLKSYPFAEFHPYTKIAETFCSWQFLNGCDVHGALWTQFIGSSLNSRAITLNIFHRFLPTAAIKASLFAGGSRCPCARLLHSQAPQVLYFLSHTNALVSNWRRPQ